MEKNHGKWEKLFGNYKINSFKKSRNLVGKLLEEQKFKSVLTTLSTDKRGLWEEKEPKQGVRSHVGPVKDREAKEEEWVTMPCLACWKGVSS